MAKFWLWCLYLFQDGPEIKFRGISGYETLKTLCSFYFNPWLISVIHNLDFYISKLGNIVIICSCVLIDYRAPAQLPVIEGATYTQTDDVNRCSKVIIAVEIL